MYRVPSIRGAEKLTICRAKSGRLWPAAVKKWPIFQRRHRWIRIDAVYWSLLQMIRQSTNNYQFDEVNLDNDDTAFVFWKFRRFLLRCTEAVWIIKMLLFRVKDYRSRNIHLSFLSESFWCRHKLKNQIHTRINNLKMCTIQNNLRF